jgi:hypothetical protein
MKYIPIPLLALLVACISSCAAVREHRELSQPENKQLTASVGSTLFRLSKKSDLPNAVGGRDIYGGKVDRGYAEAKLAGIANGSRLKLLVCDVSRESSENTMERYGRRSLVDINQNIVIGSSTSDGWIPVFLDTNQEREYTLAGIRMKIIQVRGSSITYTISDIEK